MIERVIKVFLGLVAILFIMHDPSSIVDVAQAFIDAAKKVAVAITHLKIT